MPVFKGNTSTSAESTPYGVPAKIKSFSLTNMTGGAITVNVAIFYGSSIVQISPLNYSLSAGMMLEDDKEILIPRNYQIYISVSGSCDYYFTIE